MQQPLVKREVEQRDVARAAGGRDSGRRDDDEEGLFLAPFRGGRDGGEDRARRVRADARVVHRDGRERVGRQVDGRGAHAADDGVGRGRESLLHRGGVADVALRYG